MWYDAWGLDALDDAAPPIILDDKGSRVDPLDMILGKAKFPLRLPPDLSGQSYPYFPALPLAYRTTIRVWPDNVIANTHSLLEQWSNLAYGRHSLHLRQIIRSYCRLQQKRLHSPCAGKVAFPFERAVTNLQGLEQEEITHRAEECAGAILLFGWFHEDKLIPTLTSAFSRSPGFLLTALNKNRKLCPRPPMLRSPSSRPPAKSPGFPVPALSPQQIRPSSFHRQTPSG